MVSALGLKSLPAFTVQWAESEFVFRRLHGEFLESFMQLTAPADTLIQSAYSAAKERYAALGVDVDAAMARLRTIAISLHCWQGDDVGGFEAVDAASGGGIQATGNYPGHGPPAYPG